MTRVLVVANRTASTPALLAEIGARARAGASVAVLIAPEKADHPDWTDEEAARLVGQAADQTVECLDAGPDALDEDVPDDIREGLPSGWKYPEVGSLT